MDERIDISIIAADNYGWIVKFKCSTYVFTDKNELMLKIAQLLPEKPSGISAG
jgi:hypothetical protein